MSRLFSLAFLASLVTLLALCCWVVAAKTAPTVDLPYSSYQSVLDTMNNVTSFLGMRYAAPPTGTLRFQAPQAPATTPGVQSASTFPAQCYQAATGASATNPFSSLASQGVGPTHKKRQSGTSEDCLFLSVTVPGSSGALPAANTYPVVVWIHGGGYISGSEAAFDGTDLVQDSVYQAIGVTIQYRLGVFGFLPGSDVKANGALNAGLLDQRFALQWVQSYISQFGGDPSRVTIWGLSAGAGSVLQHMIANEGATDPPLFRAVMTSSTFLPSQFWYNDTVPEYVYSQVVDAADCSTASSPFTCLQDVDADAMGNIGNTLNNDGFFGTFVTVPVIDGTFITDSPTAILKRGHVNGEVLLAVTNTFEGSNFVGTSGTSATSNLTLYVQQLFPFMSDAQVREAASLYEPVDPDSTYAQSVGAIGESIFVCPTYLLLQTFATLGRPQWKGEFAIPPGRHGEDRQFYFNDPGTLPVYPNLDFQRAFASAFLSTVVNLDPNTKVNASTITPNWPTWNASRPGTEMLFNSTDGTAADSLPVVQSIQTDEVLLQRCAFWQSVSGLVGQ